MARRSYEQQKLKREQLGRELREIARRKKEGRKAWLKWRDKNVFRCDSGKYPEGKCHGDHSRLMRMYLVDLPNGQYAYVCWQKFCFNWRAMGLKIDPRISLSRRRD
jgi:hypothetical protein